MKKIILILFIAGFFLSCSKKEKFVEPEFVLNKWCQSIKNLNYSSYKKYEAYPKERAVFREMYRDYYLKSPLIMKIQDLDEKKIHIDSDKLSYMKRNVSFECDLVLRRTGKVDRMIRGDVDFIKFVNSSRSSEGWLMSNRSLIHIKVEDRK